MFDLRNNHKCISGQLLMIKVPEGKTYEEQYSNCMNMKKSCFPLIIILNFVFAFIYLLISHGSIPLYRCFPYIIFYSIAILGLYPYETYKTLVLLKESHIYY